MNAGGAKIDTDGIKCGFRGAQHNGNGAPNGGVRPVLRHQFCAHRQGGAAAQGANKHQQGSFRRDTEPSKNRRQKTADPIDRSGCTKHGYTAKQHDQRGDDAKQKLQTIGGTGKQKIISIFLAVKGHQGSDQKQKGNYVISHGARPSPCTTQPTIRIRQSIGW